jgi:hypothetical protein
MTTNTNVREFAGQLADIYERAADLKCEERALIDAAKEAGINTRALKKVAKELGADSKKLAQKLADEEQLDLFRSQVGLLRLKGLEGRQMEAAA